MFGLFLKKSKYGVIEEMGAFFECGIVDLEQGYWSSALKGDFAANFSIRIDDLA